MREKQYKGKTRAEWIVTKGMKPIGNFAAASQTDIEEALQWFEEQDRADRFQTEERRFRQTRQIAILALLVSAGSLAVAIVALCIRSSHSPPSSVLTPLSSPTVSHSATSALPAGTAKP